eukprot:TRINITY_DN19074_c1_g1_i1.p1 TRINITY_DN19074_c1_g1~~TRINITY_DN19074_c1_g1_i1.p1  ORF type:complete len:291 (+),score=21.06 TRINITY_DN19074_c1_g1_i1:314-1186(+)
MPSSIIVLLQAFRKRIAHIFRCLNFDQKVSPCGNGLPPRIHQKLNISSYNPQIQRVIIVGDIHGCFDEFEDLLNICKYSKDSDQLILVGDLVNKGPKSIEVIQKCRELKAFMVRGNHDDSILASYNEKGVYSKCPEMTVKDADYLKDSPFSLTLSDIGVIIVHAGIVPGTSIEQQQLVDMYTMRNIVTCNGKLKATQEVGGDGEPWVNFWKGPQHIVFGHDAVRGLQLGDHYTGLDGGCVYGKSLHAMVFDYQQVANNWKGQSVTRETLNAKIVSAQARQMYEVPSHLKK